MAAGKPADLTVVDGVQAAVEDVSSEPSTERSPELLEKLHGLQADLHRDCSVEPELLELEQEYSEAVYAEWIYLLSHLRFPPDEAKRHWERIQSHCQDMQESLGSPVDLRVALASYFLEVNRKLENPKIIEMKLFERTQTSAYRDELTGLYNFRLFREYLSREVYRSERNGSPLSLIMLDVDDFKKYNDHRGHEAGNEALARIAALLAGSLRKGDIPARYGGEEFALILPGTPKNNAQGVAERTRETIERHSFQSGGKLTVSLGIATYPADAQDTGELVRRADRAMYFSKANGKNQVTLYGRSRRSHRRVEAELGGCYRVLADEPYLLTTLNISEAGLLFLAERRLSVGSLIEIRLSLGRPNPEVKVAGRVIHVEATDEGRFQTAVHITDAPLADRARLVRFIRQVKDAG